LIVRPSRVAPPPRRVVRVVVAARPLVRRRDVARLVSRRDVLPERARLVVRVPRVVRLRVVVDVDVLRRVPVEARVRVPAVLLRVARRAVPPVAVPVVRRRVVPPGRVADPLRLRELAAVRCVACPSSPWCFITVRAATSFARLP
jgi:hypothetical protein